MSIVRENARTLLKTDLFDQIKNRVKIFVFVIVSDEEPFRNPDVYDAITDLDVWSIR
jgi:hypothetical protein